MGEETTNEVKMTKEDYDNIPVFYCKHCLSLRIIQIKHMDIDACDSCGSTDLGLTSIQEWEKMYEQKYGHKYLTEY